MYVHATKTPNGFLHQVYLDGQLLPACFEADEEGGWARCHEVEPIPRVNRTVLPYRLITNADGQFIELIKRGRIEIRRP